MATTTTLATTYAGKVAGGYIKSAFLANESLQYLTFKENIDYKEVVRKIVDNVTFAAPTCDFSDSGTIALSERILTLEKFQVDRTLCSKDFLTDWDTSYAQNGEITPDLLEAVTATMLGGIGANNERLIWKGVNATTGEYAGFEALLTADADVIDVANVAITKSNVVTEIEKVIAAMPIRVRRATEKPILYVSSNVAEAYRNAMATAGNGFFYQAGESISMTWLGQYTIAECPGMSDDTMVFAQKSNMWFGTNTAAQWNEVAVMSMRNVNLDRTVRFSAQFLAGVQYGFGNEIVFYS
jgi:hypothetical protein